jgi:Bromodomain
LQLLNVLIVGSLMRNNVIVAVCISSPVTCTVSNHISAVCYVLARLLLTQQVYEEPVTDDVAPRYTEIIKMPTCFTTIEEALHSSAYADAAQFRDALILVFANCMSYNNQTTLYYALAQSLASEMRNLWQQRAAEALSSTGAASSEL